MTATILDAPNPDTAMAVSPVQGLEPAAALSSAATMAEFHARVPVASLQVAFKRAIDILGSVAGLLMLCPIFLVLALAVRLSSPGPVFYKSLRIGKNRRPFYMYKFRTMIQSADRMRSYLKVRHRLDGELFKLREDNRITPVGKILRQYSLDELPQLINVLRGEMSLVGPRPFVPDESAMFEPPFTLRFQVMPGMTGPWQVNGRSDISFRELCQLEMQYVLDWHLLRDIILLCKTVPTVFLRVGAY